MAPGIDTTAVGRVVDERWDAEVMPALLDLVRIPAKSPAFDPEWDAHGHIAAAVDLVVGWAEAQGIEGTSVEVHRLPGRTPLVLAEIPPTAGGDPTDTVLLYGHVDKQPEMVGWRDGLSPWEPVLDGDRLYGRGGADDGYAAFAAVTALRALREVGGDHARCVLVLEASEESGSSDLEPYVEALADRLGPVSLVVCLDSGCGTYDRLWTTTSLRGLAAATVRAEVLTEGVHSGAASGIVPSSFRILRQLLSRVEDEATGEVLVPELHVEIPAERLAQAAEAAQVLGPMHEGFPLVPGGRPAVEDPTGQLLARTWRPALSIIGADGLPSLVDAGNVLRPGTALRLSMRIPPRCEPEAAARALAAVLEADPPLGARVTVDHLEWAPGWDAPPTAPWLAAAVHAASTAAFGTPPASMGEGGTIPFMGMLGERFPDAQFLVIGVLGPGSNAHGPNEFLHVPMARGITAAVAQVLHAHRHRHRG